MKNKTIYYRFYDLGAKRYMFSGYNLTTENDCMEQLIDWWDQDDESNVYNKMTLSDFCAHNNLIMETQSKPFEPHPEENS